MRNWFATQFFNASPNAPGKVMPMLFLNLESLLMNNFKIVLWSLDPMLFVVLEVVDDKSLVVLINRKL